MFACCRKFLSDWSYSHHELFLRFFLIFLIKNSSHFSPCPSNVQTPPQTNLPHILRETRNDQSDEPMVAANQEADESVNTTMSEDITESSTIMDSSDSSHQMDLR